MTSEQRLGISPQPPESCPIVDAALERLGDIDQRLHFYRTSYLPAPPYVSWQVSDRVDDLRRDLESLRAANEAIRRWGQEWKDLAKRLSRSQNPESIYRQPESRNQTP